MMIAGEEFSMLHDYPDIRKRIKDPILWYDKHGVPRYDPHHPDLCPDIYADEVALLRIACQACRQEFDVQVSARRFPKETTLADDVLANAVHYGDPPRHGFGIDPGHPCGGGDTMTCEALAVLEFWQENKDYDWVRVPELEITLDEKTKA